MIGVLPPDARLAHTLRHGGVVMLGLLRLEITVAAGQRAAQQGAGQQKRVVTAAG